MSQASDPTNNPLVKALQRKCNHQADRIDELEETVRDLEATVEMLKNEIAEGEQ